MSFYLLLALIMLLTALALTLYRRFDFPFKPYIPPILIIYVLFLALANSGTIDSALLKDPRLDRLLYNLLPAMLFLMMLNFSWSHFKKLGPRMILAFFSATLSLFVAFIAAFLLFKPLLFADAYKELAALSGSWSGGSANMLAVAAAIELDAKDLAPVILVDTVLYALWLMFLLATTSLAPLFNRLTRSTLHYTDLYEDKSCIISTQSFSYTRLILIALIVAFVSNFFAKSLPSFGFMGTHFYLIIIATLLGVLASFTPLKQAKGSQSIADNMLYLIIALLALKGHISQLGQMGVLFAVGASILLLHAFLLFVLAKLFRLDLFSVGVASLSHIGGIASAPVLASAYDKRLIPVGVAMATFGYLLGTVVGLALATVLAFLS